MSNNKKNDQWIFYIIQNCGSTYAGVSPDPSRRLRQHNGELKGGAKYTISKGSGWTHICLVKGFRTKIEAMQFEWAVKHASPRNAGGIANRIKKLYTTCAKERWTSNAPPACDVPLTILWLNYVVTDHTPLPEYVSELTMCDEGIMDRKSV
uniref:GIY-YIG domain-containing protein n=1 Tax=viral metagenome TaxID=1070528 RepID=A0A6C0KXR6_9ZZZZ|tara:strand:+ start:1404 stop:1856 length:453 start_codon:yes stop_codon:yes gene_type:complete